MKILSSLLFVILLFFTLVFSSCSSDELKSEKIIDKTVFEEILYEVHMADAKKEVSNAVSNENNYLLPEYYQKEIFESYNIDIEIFTWNIVYYSSRNEIDDMYSNVLMRLNQEKAELEKEKYKRFIKKGKKNKLPNKKNPKGAILN